MIAGVDEAGRGAWVGSVVAAAVILPEDFSDPRLRDSKRLSAKMRERLFALIDKEAVAWAYGEADCGEIDALNVLQATFLAMRRAVCKLKVKPEMVWVDGNLVPSGLSVPARALVGGDDLLPAISAASVMAKVVRDRQMQVLHARFPEYGFDRHKGYGTAAHRAALLRFGALDCHRKSFRPVASLLSNLF